MNLKNSKFTIKSTNETSQFEGTNKTLSQPFNEFPTPSVVPNGNEDRINAHELFSFYTADVIREENVFVR